MKKIIAFADTEELSKHYDELLDQGAKHLAPKIRGHEGDLRRATIETKDGDLLELIFINVHIGDLLLHNREAGLVDISRVINELDKAKETIEGLAHKIQAAHKEKLELA